MRAKKTVYYVLMFLPLILAGIAMFYLPDRIPAHYNASGQVDRWGSKYESFILPVTTILFGLLMLGMAKWTGKEEKSGRNNEKVCLITGMSCLAVFNVMNGYFLYTSFREVENLYDVALDINQVIFGVCGIMMVVAGNVMPKLRRNSLIGLRTGWSMKNETTWKKSQLFGGISFMIGGILIVVGCLLTKGFRCFLWSMAVFLLILIIDVYYAYRIGRKYGNEETVNSYSAE